MKLRDLLDLDFVPPKKVYTKLCDFCGGNWCSSCGYRKYINDEYTVL